MGAGSATGAYGSFSGPTTSKPYYSSNGSSASCTNNGTSNYGINQYNYNQNLPGAGAGDHTTTAAKSPSTRRNLPPPPPPPAPFLAAAQVNTMVGAAAGGGTAMGMHNLFAQQQQQQTNPGGSFVHTPQGQQQSSAHNSLQQFYNATNSSFNTATNNTNSLSNTNNSLQQMQTCSSQQLYPGQVFNAYNPGTAPAGTTTQPYQAIQASNHTTGRCTMVQLQPGQPPLPISSIGGSHIPGEGKSVALVQKD